jgi:two-component system phosphate regulon response regulator PhoB
MHLETVPLIVVADDDQDILNLLRKRLTKRGYHVVPTSNGQQALETIRHRRPAVAILDWMMPIMPGHQVCAQLKADPETAAIPVVLLTAKVMEKDVETAFDKGADEYLTKPFDITELDHILKSLITE